MITVSINVEVKDKSLAIKHAEAMYWQAIEKGYRVLAITINGKDEFKSVYWYSKFLRG
jgi:hypothetical protein